MLFVHFLVSFSTMAFIVAFFIDKYLMFMKLLHCPSDRKKYTGNLILFDNFDAI
jgi:hypothetical protein